MADGLTETRYNGCDRHHPHTGTAVNALKAVSQRCRDQITLDSGIAVIGYSQVFLAPGFGTTNQGLLSGGWLQHGQIFGKGIQSTGYMLDQTSVNRYTVPSRVVR
ncbi:hypothetical protein DSECCO2_578710 [anaerobic digester metagenome]